MNETCVPTSLPTTGAAATQAQRFGQESRPLAPVQRRVPRKPKVVAHARAQEQGLRTTAANLPAVDASRLSPDEAILTATVGDQSLKVEDRQALARCAERRELVIVIVRRAEGVEADHVRPPL